ncbi:MAG: hypothetical protein AB7T37_03275 [Dehalococcoidia bacterium]
MSEPAVLGVLPESVGHFDTGTNGSASSDPPSLAIRVLFPIGTGTWGSTDELGSEPPDLTEGGGSRGPDVFPSNQSPLASKIAELVAHSSVLADYQLTQSLIQPFFYEAVDDLPFAQGAEGLRRRLLRFPEMTKDWPEFSHKEFPHASIDAALRMFADAWEHIGPRGRAAIQTAFCGPSEEGAVNCQWRRDGLFLGLSVGPEGLPEAFFCDERTGEEFEGQPDLASFVDWIERF